MSGSFKKLDEVLPDRNTAAALTDSVLRKLGGLTSFTEQESSLVEILLKAAASRSDWLTDEGYELIYRLVPRVCVDIVILNTESQVFFTKRNISPFLGKCSLPGGMIKKGESAEEALERICKKELGVSPQSARLLDYMDFVEDGDPEDPLFGPNGGHLHSVSMIFLCEVDTSSIVLNGAEASDYGWFDTMSDDIHPVHGATLVRSDYLRLAK